MLHFAPCCHRCGECGEMIDAAISRDHIRLCSLRPERLSVSTSTAEIDRKEEEFWAMIDTPFGAGRGPLFDHPARRSISTLAAR